MDANIPREPSQTTELFQYIYIKPFDNPFLQNISNFASIEKADENEANKEPSNEVKQNEEHKDCSLIPIEILEFYFYVNFDEIPTQIRLL